MKKNNCQVDSISAHEGFLRLYWSGDCGFGTYDICFNDYHQSENEEMLNIEGFSENMDCNDDKSFLKMLLDNLIKKINIVD